MARQRDTYIGHYEDVAKSQTAQVLGASGAVGDYLQGILVVPETTAPGTIALLDGDVSRNILVTGTYELRPIWLALGMRSVNGAWKITTGDNVHCIAVGVFS